MTTITTTPTEARTHRPHGVSMRSHWWLLLLVAVGTGPLAVLFAYAHHYALTV